MARFLEPMYLNDRMVLDCAAYLWKGVALETSTTSQEKTTLSGSAKVGVPLLGKLLGLQGSADRGAETTSRLDRRYTMGGLHMAVIDELSDKGMVKKYVADADALDRSLYYEVEAILRPIEFFALLATLKATAPLLLPILRDFGDKFISKPAAGKSRKSIKDTVREYEGVVVSTIDALIADYLRAKQLELIMYSPEDATTPIGVVDVDLTGIDADETRARLADGQFTIIGKVVRWVPPGENLGLLQRSVLSALGSLLTRMSSMVPESDGASGMIAGLAVLRDNAGKLMRLQLEGPVIRVAAMSICV